MQYVYTISQLDSFPITLRRFFPVHLQRVTGTCRLLLSYQNREPGAGCGRSEPPAIAIRLVDHYSPEALQDEFIGRAPRRERTECP